MLLIRGGVEIAKIKQHMQNPPQYDPTAGGRNLRQTEKDEEHVPICLGGQNRSYPKLYSADGMS